MQKEWFEDLVSCGLSTREIAARCKKSQTTVRYWLAKFGLKTVYSERHGASGGAEEFWNWVDVGEPDECWRWKQARRGEYGKYRLNGKRMGANRAAWRIANGPIPVGMEVCHHCDNSRCMNPSHLFLGTHQDNMRDAYAKGRINPPPLCVRVGIENHSAKLTEVDVRSIRARYADGETQTSIAQDFPVSSQQICEIVHRKCWNHI